MAAHEDLTDDYIVNLLKSDATKIRNTTSYGLVHSPPRRAPGSAAPRPNTRFLRNLVRDTDSHNAALLAKERRESKARHEKLRGLEHGRLSPRKDDRISSAAGITQQAKDNDHGSKRGARWDRARNNGSARNAVDEAASSTWKPSKSSKKIQMHAEFESREERRARRRQKYTEGDELEVENDDRRSEEHTPEQREPRKRKHARDDDQLETREERRARRKRERAESDEQQTVKVGSNLRDHNSELHKRRKQKHVDDEDQQIAEPGTRSPDRSPGHSRQRIKKYLHHSASVERNESRASDGAGSQLRKGKSKERKLSHSDSRIWADQGGSKVVKSETQRHTVPPTGQRDQSERDNSDPLEALVGPLPSEAPRVRTRGRGTFSTKKAFMDERFDSHYDPAMDVQPDSAEEDDWDQALEVIRDRQKWQQAGAERLRAAGFTEEQVSKWEKKGKSDEGDVGDIRWKHRQEGREWDRGKVVKLDADDVDGFDVEVRADWNFGRLK